MALMNTILLVDDHAVVRAGFKLLLAAQETYNVVAEADRGESAIQLYQQHQPDIVIMDLSMPGIGGLETIRRIVARYDKAKILVFSVHDEQVYISRAFQAGAMGYITKNSAPEILTEAIDAILRNEQYIETGLSKQKTNQAELDYQKIIETFSAREFDIFRLLAKGLSNHMIADQLCLGYKTIANYSTQIKKKLQVSNVAELAHVAVMLGIMKH